MSRPNGDKMTTSEINPMQAMASLYRKKVSVLKALSGGLEKGGTNTFHKYQYVEASDVKHAVGLALIDAGLSLQMSVIESRHISVPGKNGDALILQVQFQISLCDIDTGAIETSLWLGEAGLTGQDDKAANKAATAALKYYLLSNFLIGDKEEDERDADKDAEKGTDRKASNSNKPRPAQSPTPSAPTKPAPVADLLRYDDADRFPKFLAWAKKTYSMSEADAMEALYQINGAKFQEAAADQARQACEAWAQSKKKAS
jgi:hypothetical protein